MSISIEDISSEDVKRISLQNAGLMQGMIVNSLMTSRANLLGTTLDRDPNRDTNKECGYPESITLQNYYDMFERSGYAKRVVTIHPDETWSVVPELWETEDQQETPFETAWNDLMFEINIWHYLYRVDVLSGIGQYGVLYISFDDDKDPSIPVGGINPKTGKLDETTRPDKMELNFLRAFSHKEVQIVEKDNDPRSPRFGMPVMYAINFADSSAPAPGSDSSDTNVPEDFGTKVHWTRILHVADNRLSSEILGTPRQQHVYNRLLDLRKVLGGSGEMFWKGAFPGYSFETHPEYVNVNGGTAATAQAIKDEFEEYYNGLKRYIALSGMSVKPLMPQVANPTNHVDENLKEITTCLTVPMTVFVGYQTGHLASTADIATWNKRVAKRQTDYVNPMMIVPFVRRLSFAGVLPIVKRFTISWTDLNALSDTDKADIAVKRTQSLLQYTTSGAETIMPVFNYFTLILGLSIEQAMAVQSEVEKREALITEDVWMAPPTQAPGSGTADQTKKTNQNRNMQKQ